MFHSLGNPGGLVRLYRFSLDKSHQPVFTSGILTHGLPMSEKKRLSGIFTPNIIPLDNQGRIHEEETRRYVDWLIDHGVHGLYPNGSTGEFTRFTAEERIRIIEIITDQIGRAHV